MDAKEKFFTDAVYVEGKRNSSNDFLGGYEGVREHKPEISKRGTCMAAIVENTKLSSSRAERQPDKRKNLSSQMLAYYLEFMRFSHE